MANGEFLLSVEPSFVGQKIYIRLQQRHQTFPLRRPRKGRKGRLSASGWLPCCMGAKLEWRPQKVWIFRTPLVTAPFITPISTIISFWRTPSLQSVRTKSHKYALLPGSLVGSASQVSGCKRPLDLNRPTRRLQGGPTGFDHSELLLIQLISCSQVAQTSLGRNGRNTKSKSRNKVHQTWGLPFSQSL